MFSDLLTRGLGGLYVLIASEFSSVTLDIELSEYGSGCHFVVASVDSEDFLFFGSFRRSGAIDCPVHLNVSSFVLMVRVLSFKN